MLADDKILKNVFQQGVHRVFHRVVNTFISFLQKDPFFYMFLLDLMCKNESGYLEVGFVFLL